MNIYGKETGKTSSSLYFIAIIPPPDICSEIIAVKNDFRERFRSMHALRTIPHITLKAPFSITDEERNALVDWFNEFDAGIAPFNQALHNFSCFAGRRNPVIFIEPQMNVSLKSLQEKIVSGIKQRFPDVSVAANENYFHPHVTVGYRDLTYDNFTLAWEEYRNKTFNRVFRVENFCLLQHDRKQWNIVAVHPLS